MFCMIKELFRMVKTTGFYHLQGCVFDIQVKRCTVQFFQFYSKPHALRRKNDFQKSSKRPFYSLFLTGSFFRRKNMWGSTLQKMKLFLFSWKPISKKYGIRLIFALFWRISFHNYFHSFSIENKRQPNSLTINLLFFKEFLFLLYSGINQFQKQFFHTYIFFKNHFLSRISNPSYSWK